MMFKIKVFLIVLTCITGGFSAYHFAKIYYPIPVPVADEVGTRPIPKIDYGADRNR